MNTLKRYSEPKKVETPVPELAPVFEVTMPAPDMTGVVDIIQQVVNRPSEVNVAAPEVTVNVPKPECKLKKWDIEFRRNNMGITGAVITELPYDDR